MVLCDWTLWFLDIIDIVSWFLDPVYLLFLWETVSIDEVDGLFDIRLFESSYINFWLFMVYSKSELFSLIFNGGILAVWGLFLACFFEEPWEGAYSENELGLLNFF